MEQQSLHAPRSGKTRGPESRRSRAAPLSRDALAKIDAYWRAANYLGQIYLYDNPLLKAPLTLDHIKPRLVGDWGTTPGLTFVYTHLNRAIVAHDLSVLFVTGLGHGGPALMAGTYLEGTYSERYAEVTQDEAGMRQLFKQFSFPGGVPSHVAAETPGLHLVNVIVAGKQPAPQWLSLDAAVRHCEAGIGTWEWASCSAEAMPDGVMACCGDVPTLETLAAVALLREHLPEVKVRVVNVVDVMQDALQRHARYINEHGEDMPEIRDWRWRV